MVNMFSEGLHNYIYALFRWFGLQLKKLPSLTSSHISNNLHTLQVTQFAMNNLQCIMFVMIVFTWLCTWVMYILLLVHLCQRMQTTSRIPQNARISPELCLKICKLYITYMSINKARRNFVVCIYNKKPAPVSLYLLYTVCRI